MSNKLLLAILFGVLLGLSWPVGGFTPLLFIAFVPFLLLFDVAKRDRNWRVFGLFNVGFVLWNTITTWWLWNATALGMLFALLVNSMLMTLVVMLWKRVDKKLGRKAGLLFLPFAWISFEKMHLIWDFSWPWLNLGNGFASHPNWVQWYAFTGSFGGTLWVWIVNIAFYFSFKQFLKNKKIGKTWLKPVGLIFLPILISYIIEHQFKEENNEPITATVVQPNIDPYKEKYHLSNQEFFDDLIGLITPELSKKTDLIVTPETYFAEGVGEHLLRMEKSKLYQDLLLFSTENQLQFLNGIQFFNTYSEDNKTETANELNNGVWADFYNSAFLTDSTEIQVYHKSKLVVGVETIPYPKVTKKILKSKMLDLGGTTLSRATQSEREAFSLYNKVKVGPIICYESVYGEYVTQYVQKGAGILVIMTNDAWWGNTAGHKQHLAYARLRAIENRRPIARSANTGISAFISPLGEITSQLAYNQKGVLTAMIAPQYKMTFYTTYGDYIFRLGCFLAGFLFLFTFARKKS